MTDVTIHYPTHDPAITPAEEYLLLIDLASDKPNQKKDIKHIFSGLVSYLRDFKIQVGSASAKYTNGQLYQIEWNLYAHDTNAEFHGYRYAGDLVFGRKLPTIYSQSPLRKFWIRQRRDFRLGDITPSLLTVYYRYDHLYFHDHGEARQLNEYSRGEDGDAHCHESADNKNPKWFLVSPV